MKVLQTEDYKIFKRIQGNRILNKAQISKLYRSLGENPELASAAPIIVNDKMEVIDGQHRLEALKKLGLPVTYIVHDKLTLKDVQLLNSATKVWNPVDYARSYSELGLKDYDIYLLFRKKYGLSHNILMSYLSLVPNDSMMGNTNTVQSFRKGEFKVGDVKAAHTLCQRLKEMQQYYDRGDSRAFALAFKMANKHPRYDHKRMMSKMEEKSSLLKDSPYAEDYMRQLERIYNFHCGINRVKLF